MAGWSGTLQISHVDNSSKLEHIILVNPQEDNCHFINLTGNKDLCMFSTNIYKASALCQALL